MIHPGAAAAARGGSGSPSLIFRNTIRSWRRVEWPCQNSITEGWRQKPPLYARRKENIHTAQNCSFTGLFRNWAPSESHGCALSLISQVAAGVWWMLELMFRALSFICVLYKNVVPLVCYIHNHWHYKQLYWLIIWYIALLNLWQAIL